MKIQNLLVLLIMFFPTVYAEGRPWKDVRGNTLEASYVGRSTDPGKVILELPDGKRKVFLISQFSEEDQQYLQKKANKKRKSSENSSQIAERKPKETSDLPKPTADLGAMKETASGGVRVRVEGYGETIKEAKQDAMRTAVEQVVGMLVDAQTRMECDEVIEKILTATGAYVESNKVLNASVKDGVCTVQLEAVVVKNAISNKLQSVNRGSSMKIDGGAIFDQIDSKVQSEKEGVMFLANFLKEEQFPYSLMDVSFNGQPKIEQKEGDYTYTVWWTVKVNMARYSAFIKKLTEILDKVAIRKTTFTLDLERDEHGNLIYYESGIPDCDKRYCSFRVCTNLTGSTNKQARFIQYELPRKYRYLICQYGSLIPAIEINLLDSNKEIVSTQYGKLFDDYHTGWIFNLSNDIEDFDRYYDVAIKGNSVLAKPFDDSINPAIIPFHTEAMLKWHDVDESFSGNTKFILSSEDLKKVSSAEIHVVSNNPDMDKVYEKLESEIDKIATSINRAASDEEDDMEVEE